MARLRQTALSGLLTTGLLLSLAGLSACETVQALNIEVDEARSGKVAGQSVRLYYLRAESNPKDVKPYREMIESVQWEDFRKAVNRCPKPEFPTTVGPLGVVVPFVAYGAKVAFEHAVGALASRIERLKNGAQRTYSARITTRYSVLQMTGPTNYPIDCLIVVRRTAAAEKGRPPETGLALIIETWHRGDSIVLKPSYLRMGDAVALTTVAEDGGQSTVDLSVAISVKKLYRDKDGTVSRRQAVAESLGTYSGVRLGGPARFDCGEPKVGCGPESDIIAPLGSKPRGASLTVAITETGTISVDVDRAQAEIKAFAAAIGPQLNKALESFVTRAAE